MRRYLLRDSNGVTVGSITRTSKCYPLYNISYYKAERDIGWEKTKNVGYEDTVLFVYMFGGREEAIEFIAWVKEGG